MGWGWLISVSHVAEMRDSAGQGSTDPSELIPAHTVLDLSLYLLPTRDLVDCIWGSTMFQYSLHGVETTFWCSAWEEAAGKPRLPAHLLELKPRVLD